MGKKESKNKEVAGNSVLSFIGALLDVPELELHKFYILLVVFLLVVLFIFKDSIDPVHAVVSSVMVILLLSILVAVIKLAKIKSKNQSETIELLNETIEQLKLELREKVTEKQIQDSNLKKKPELDETFEN